MRKIILIGYMGSGKSTIAALLAQRLNKKFIDLDNVIERSTGHSISEIFDEKGELHFRKLEHRIFSELLSNEDEFILAVGGGTPCYANNHLLLNGDGIVSIYLKASIDTLSDRLYHAAADRPLLAQLESGEFREFIAKNLFDRSFYYNQATYKISIDGKDLSAILSEIENLLT